jgi:hypothetical protein
MAPDLKQRAMRDQFCNGAVSREEQPPTSFVHRKGRRVDLGHECVVGIAAQAALPRVGGGEIDRGCIARNIHVARGVHRDAGARIDPVPK